MTPVILPARYTVCTRWNMDVLELFRRRWLIALAVMLASVTFAPLAAAMAACDIACIGGSSMHHQETAQQSGHGKHTSTKGAGGRGAATWQALPRRFAATDGKRQRTSANADW